MDSQDPDVRDADESDHPRGTLLVAAVFLGLLALSWILMYLMMLSRS